MNFLVRDTKNHNKDPFWISQVGFDGLKKKFGGRYVQATEIKVDKQIGVVKVPTVIETPKVQEKAARQRRGQG